MKKILLILLASMFSISLLAQWTRNGQFSANGGGVNDVYTESPASGLGLQNIYVFKNLASSTVSYETAKNNTVKIYTYQNSISDKLPVPLAYVDSIFLGDRKTYTVSNLKDNEGLVMDDNNQSHSVWIIDYNLHKPKLHSITPVESDDRCEALKLVIVKDDLLEYRGTGGQVRAINRKYDISYQKDVWNETDFEFTKTDIIEENIIVGTEYVIVAPNMNTTFTLSGDQFGKKFEIPEKELSEEYQAVAVEPHIKTIQAPKDAENEGQEGKELGGSAPIDIQFFGYANKDVAYYYTWFVYDKKDMNNPIARYTDENFEYTFEQFGNYEVVLEVANGESSCVSTESVSFEIFESDLDIPNFFSPGSSPGSNDEFKVYHKSLIKYHIVIFNRWGNKVYESRDPAQGWDGRYKGSLVHPGVYFYSIQATGSDGRKWKKGGDINILR